MSKKITKEDLADFRRVALEQGELRVHLICSRGGTVSARMWHPDGAVIAKAGGGGYDKRGAALGDLMAKVFAPDLFTLPLPVDNQGLYGLGEFKGNRYLDGACGTDSMLKVLRALGFTSTRLLETGRDSSMVLATREVTK